MMERLSAQDVAQAIRALLDQPNANWFDAGRPRCECAGCQAIRARGIHCKLCGFRGEPVVEPCVCRDTRASNIEVCRRDLADLAAGTSAPGGYSKAQLEDMLQRNLARPDRDCTARRRAPRDGADEHWCGHGSTTCPTCGAMDGCTTAPIEGTALAATIRDVRALLARTIPLDR